MKPEYHLSDSIRYRSVYHVDCHSVGRVCYKLLPNLQPLLLSYLIMNIIRHNVYHLHNGRRYIKSFWYFSASYNSRFIFSSMLKCSWESYLCKFLTEFKWWVVWSIHKYYSSSDKKSGSSSLGSSSYGLSDSLSAHSNISSAVSSAGISYVSM